jgi:hypothetical protein
MDSQYEGQNSSENLLLTIKRARVVKRDFVTSLKRGARAISES